VKDVTHHVVGEGVGRGGRWLTETLYDSFGETIVVVALLSVLIVPCTWNVLTAKRQDGDGTDIVEPYIHGFLLFAAFGIASRVAYWLICLEKVAPVLIMIAFLGAFIGSCAIWLFSSKLGDELSCFRTGQPSEWFRKSVKESASLEHSNIHVDFDYNSQLDPLELLQQLQERSRTVEQQRRAESQQITSSTPSESKEGIREHTYEIQRDYTIEFGVVRIRLKRGEQYHGRILADHAEIDIGGFSYTVPSGILSAPKD
jgi:hypothetical protein